MFVHWMPKSGVLLTVEEVLDPEVADTEAQDRKFIQFGDDVRGEWQEAGQPVQLCVQSVPVPLGWVGLLIHWHRFP